MKKGFVLSPWFSLKPVALKSIDIVHHRDEKLRGNLNEIS